MISTIRRYIAQPPSLYSRIVLLILSISLIFFVFLAIIIYSVSNNYMEKVTLRCGERVARLVDRALQTTMMSSDHTELVQTIDYLCEIPGIRNISIYNSDGHVQHATRGNIFHPDTVLKTQFSCNDCHISADTTRWIEKGVCVFNKDIDGGRELVILAPVLNLEGCSSIDCHAEEAGNELLGLLEIELPLNEMDNALNRTIFNYFIIVLLFIMSFTGILLVFAHHRIHKPLSRIVTASKEVRQGNMNLRLDVASSDLSDIREVEEAFNQMLASIAETSRELQQWSHDLESKVLEKTEDLERSQNEIYHIERLASLGKLSASVAHEINNPLAGILTYAKLVSRMLTNVEFDTKKKESITSHLGMIQSETMRCGLIVRGLLDFSRDDTPNLKLTEMNKVLAETMRLVQHSFQIAGVEFTQDFSASEDRVKANPNKIKQACLAVLSNALEAVPENEGSVHYRSYNPSESLYAIEITDNGIGIDEKDKKHIFEPFFSRKRDTSGIGLGLAVTFGIVKQHDGKIEVDSAPGRGTTITFILPLANKEKHDG